jgi:serine/threonine protein kinase
MAYGESESLPVGKLVNKRFQILKVVGQGGLGTVYQVRDTVYGKGNVYALKELADQSRGARKQFMQEAKWLQALDHPHIPKVRESFEWENRLYLVMDFVDGENLDQKLRRLGGRGMLEAQVIQWIVPICDALQYLHTRNPPILHRDVKPANIIVTAAGHPVLVDLGIAKEHGPGAIETATFVRKAGTEGYAPPEQYTNAGQTGPWSDVYSLGATLYELLSGCIPPTAVERVALDVRLVPLRELNPDISPHVGAAVAKALSIRPADRYQYVADFAASLMAPDASIPGLPVHPGGFGSPLASGPLPQGNPRPLTGPMPSPPPSPLPGSGISAPSPLRWSVPPPPAPAGARSLPALKPSVPNRSAPLLAGMGGGAPVSASPVMTAAGFAGAAEAWPQTRAPSIRRGRRWFALPIVWVTAVVAVLLVAAVVGVNMLGLLNPVDRSTPQATVTGYFQALKAQDDGRAWQYSSLSRNNATQRSAFISGLQADDARFGHVTSFQLGQFASDGEGHVQATVSVTRFLQPDAPLTYTLSLTQYDGSTWLIDSVSGS